MTQFSQERQWECSKCWGLRGGSIGLLGERSQRVWRLVWEQRCHHPCKAGKCSFGKNGWAMTPSTGYYLLSDLGRRLHQMVRGEPTNVFFPLPFGRGIAFILSLDWCELPHPCLCTATVLPCHVQEIRRYSLSPLDICKYSSTSKASQRRAAVGEFK